MRTGAIFYIQDEAWWRDRYRGAPICRNPWIVEALLNGLFHASRRNRASGVWESTYVARRSDWHWPARFAMEAGEKSPSAR
ncbi:MAG: hypothetical protein WBQ75_12640 [Acetobacteraceae bacterium]